MDGQRAIPSESQATSTVLCEGQRDEILDLRATSRDCYSDIDVYECNAVDGQLRDIYELHATSTEEVPLSEDLSSLEGQRDEILDLRATSRDVRPRDGELSDGVEGDDTISIDDVKRGAGSHSDDEYIPPILVRATMIRKNIYID